MKRLTQKLLQCIRINRQRRIHRRQQLITQYQNHACNQQEKSESSDVSSDNDRFNSSKVYHQGHSQYDITRRKLYNWIAASNPTHFLTVQFPINMRSPSLDVSRNNLRRLMARFEQCLIGSQWAKSHMPFYAFAEIGPKDGYTYHFHILFNSGVYSTEEVQKSLDRASLQLSLYPGIFYLEEVKTYEIIYYCLKEVKITNHSGCYDTIIVSSDLFHI